MFKFGRYTIAFGWTFWIQTQVPTMVRHFLFIWFFKEARPEDIDKEPQFPPGTRMVYEGQKFRYLKAEHNMNKGEIVMMPKVTK